jgi:hypothetical protein
VQSTSTAETSGVIPSPITTSPVQPSQQVLASPTVPFTLEPTFPPLRLSLQLPNPPMLEGVFNFPADVNPLTGLPVADPNKLNRRPILAKVSNYPPVGRPHAGLSYADIVFEYYIGEYTNRFLALYYSQDTPKSWPLRSGRLVDPQLTNMYGGLLVYGNADPRVEIVIARELGNRAISFNIASCPAVCGKATHSATGVYVDTAATTQWAIQQGVNNDRPDLNGMVFDPRVPSNAKDAVKLGVEYIRWDRGEWRYDPESQQYLRWIEAWDGTKTYPMIPLIDEVNGKQLAFSNVIILFATYIEYNATLHDILIWDNTAGQRAVFFRDGVMQEGTWQTIGHDRPIRFSDTAGRPMALKPGNSWIVIAGRSSTFQEVQPGQWEMLFGLP